MACVRNYAGYGRFTTPEERDTLAAACRFFRPSLNCFKPTMKPADKIRAGDKVRRADDKPVSPYRRLMANPKLPEEVKAELTRRYRSYNPVVLRREVRAAIEALAGIHAAAADCQSDTRRSGHRRVRIL